MKNRIDNALKQVWQNISNPDDVDMLPPKQDDDWYPLETLLSERNLCASDFLKKARWPADLVDKKLLIILSEQNIPIDIFTKILEKFPEIQPLANGYSKTHPLVVAASKNWALFKQYLDNGTFKSKQFADLITPIAWLNNKYKGVTGNKDYKNKTACGDHFSVFLILWLSNEDYLLHKVKEVALKHPMNVLTYLDIDSIRIAPDDSSNLDEVRIQLEGNFNGNEGFALLYFIDEGTHMTYKNKIFERTLKIFFTDFATADFSEAGFNLNPGIMNDVNEDDETIEICLYIGTSEDCNKFLDYAKNYLEKEKKWLEFGYAEVKSELKASFFGQTINETDDLINIVVEYCLPKP